MDGMGKGILRNKRNHDVCFGEVSHLFYHSCPNGYKGIACCGFDLHFPDD